MFLQVDRVGYSRGGPIGTKSKQDFYKIPVYGRGWLFTGLAKSFLNSFWLCSFLHWAH